MKICLRYLSIFIILGICFITSNTAYAFTSFNDIEGLSSDGYKIKYYETLDGKPVNTMLFLNGRIIDIGVEIPFFTRADYVLDYQSVWIPIRAMSEYLGYDVVWDAENKVIYINDTNHPIQYIDRKSVDTKSILILINNVNHQKLTIGIVTYHGGIALTNINGRYYANFEQLLCAMGIENGYFLNHAHIFMSEQLSEQELANPPKLLTEYAEGFYKVGVDIPSGDYKLITDDVELIVCDDFNKTIKTSTVRAEGSLIIFKTNPENIQSYIQKYSISENLKDGQRKSLYPKPILFNDEYILHLENGTYFEIKNCKAYPLFE